MQALRQKHVSATAMMVRRHSRSVPLSSPQPALSSQLCQGSFFCDLTQCRLHVTYKLRSVPVLTSTFLELKPLV